MPTSEFRVLVTGSRVTSPDEAAFVQAVIQDAHLAEVLKSGRRLMVVVQGECPSGGVDLAAKRWAERTPGVTSESHPAEWDRHGKLAGPIRNTRMVGLGADLCLAFPAKGSRGTWDCIRKAVDAGIETRIRPLLVATHPVRGHKETGPAVDYSDEAMYGDHEPAHHFGEMERLRRSPAPSRACTCPLGPEDAHFPDCPMWVDAPEPETCLGPDMNCGRPLPCPDHPVVGGGGVRA